MDKLHPMTILNFITALALFSYAFYLIFKGRREVRPMMAVYALAGAWALGVHVLVVIDQFCCDWIARQVIVTYLIRPLLFVLMSTVLAAVIKAGWRYDDK